VAPFGGRPIGGAVEVLWTKVVHRRLSVLPIVVFFVAPPPRRCKPFSVMTLSSSAESIILSAGGAETIMLSVHAKSIILSALPTESIILSAAH
jgi:hypothetical protein